MATSIFAAPSRGGHKPLLEFKAGKMIMRGRVVSADTRKGLVQIEVTPEDNLLHFKWKDRTSGTVETDLIIFPEEATFKRIRQCQTGRVYLLEWKTTARKMFFWLQEPSEDKDEEICTKVNQYINKPPQAGHAGGADQAGGAGLNQNALMQMMQQQLAARGGGVRPVHPPTATLPSAAPTPSTATQIPPSMPGSGAIPAARARSGISADLLANVLSDLGVQGSAAGAQSGGVARREDGDLTEIMDPDALIPLLENPIIQQQLMQYLPEGNRNPEEFRQLLRSPQFAQAVRTLNAAIQSGELSELMPHFGLPSNVGGPQGGVDALMQALNTQRAAQSATQQPVQRGESMDVDNTSTKEDDDEMPPLVPEKKDDKKDDKKEGQ